jgi:hypothetical protein
VFYLWSGDATAVARRNANAPNYPAPDWSWTWNEVVGDYQFFLKKVLMSRKECWFASEVASEYFLGDAINA